MYDLKLTEKTITHISSGNIKVGAIPQFNTLPSNEVISVSTIGVLTDVKGTCSNLCEACKGSCYAIRSLKCHHNVIVKAWGENTLLLRNRPEQVKNDIINYINRKGVKYFRFHTSGEWESVEHIKLYKEICESCQDCNFYIYTKAFDLLLDYFRNGGTFPKNFIVNLSEWKGNIDTFTKENNVEDNIKALFESLNIFSYDDKTPECMVAKVSMPHCPAVNEKGKETGVTCDKCRRCMTRGHRTAVFDH